MASDNPYDVLVPWIANRLYLTEEEQWTSLNTKNITKLSATPVSLRTLMNALTPTEYVTAKTVLSTAAESNALISDVLSIMSNVGPWTDSGVDISTDTARAMIDSLFTGDNAALGTKIKALAESTVSQIESWAAQGITVNRAHLHSARSM